MATPARRSDRRSRTAIVGSGITGLTAAYLLTRTDDVTLFESQDRLGGHTHTHFVRGPGGQSIPVDSGFIVHNDRTYPLLTRLFAELGVVTRDAEMSMSISDPVSGLEYAGGKGVSGFVAHPTHLLRRDYREVLLSVRRFHRLAAEFLAESAENDLSTFGDFIATQGFSPRFTELYAVPLVACVWSAGRSDALAYPARYLFRFDHPVTSITRGDDGVTIAHARGADAFDRVVVATHADQALTLLADATPLEKEVLGAFRYSHNETVLHQDLTLLPRARRARASWNYVVAPTGRSGPAVVTYWMNKLQGLDEGTALLVTLNATDRVAADRILATMDYTHPIYDPTSVAAQRRLPEINSATTAYAGAYHGWGFHEDGCRAGVAAAGSFGATW